MPDQGKLEKFWGELWGKPTELNLEAPWLETLEQEHAVNAVQTEYQITDEVPDRVITKMANDNPGTDLTTCLWIKALQCTREHLKRNFKKSY